MAKKNYITRSSEAGGPPSAPEIPRHLAISPVRGSILAALAVIVVLALAGLFGESMGAVADQSADFGLEIEYPTRFRYKQINPVRVYVTNLTARKIDTLSVSFEDGYLDEFSNVSAVPSFSEPWRVDLTGMRPGETRDVIVGLQGEQYGRHEGSIRVFAPNADTASAHLSTFIFP
jgi:hypothetical protein